jgi:hypothetical protein
MPEWPLFKVVLIGGGLYRFLEIVATHHSLLQPNVPLPLPLLIDDILDLLTLSGFDPLLLDRTIPTSSVSGRVISLLRLVDFANWSPVPILGDCVDLSEYGLSRCDVIRRIDFIGFRPGPELRVVITILVRIKHGILDLDLDVSVVDELFLVLIVFFGSLALFVVSFVAELGLVPVLDGLVMLKIVLVFVEIEVVVFRPGVE